MEKSSRLARYARFMYREQWQGANKQIDADKERDEPHLETFKWEREMT